jgi:hypothetical protein
MMFLLNVYGLIVMISVNMRGRERNKVGAKEKGGEKVIIREVCPAGEVGVGWQWRYQARVSE